MPAARRKASFQQNNLALAPCQGCSTCYRGGQGTAGRARQSTARHGTAWHGTHGTARQGRAGQGRAGRQGQGQGQGQGLGQGQGQGQGQGRAGRGGAGQGRAPKKATVEVHLYCLTAERSFAGRRHYSPRVPGSFTLPHRAVGTLGRGPRSEPRVPMALSAV